MENLEKVFSILKDPKNCLESKKENCKSTKEYCRNLEKEFKKCLVYVGD